MATTVYQALRYDDQDECYHWERGTRASLSKNFVTTEFQCQCTHSTCKDQKIKASLIAKLQEVRNKVGPVGINSGYRCNLHQQDLRKQGYETAVGTSTHEMGWATDLSAFDMDALYKACEQVFMAIGKAKSFIHVDERRGKIRRWSYNTV